MDPITSAMIDYVKHLEGGGATMPLPYKDTSRTKVRKLHPSAIGPGLCDRRAAYNVMKDTGELKVDDYSDQQMLSFRVGHVYQQFITEALEYEGILIDHESKVEDKHWTGRVDLLVDYMERMMLVDVKTVKSKSIVDSRRFYPRPFNIAQVEKYLKLIKADVLVSPYLFYVTRVDMKTELFTWRWNGNDCIISKFNDIWEPEEYNVMYALGYEIGQSEEKQLDWLAGGDLPPRCGSTPDEHTFMCVSKSKGIATPSCLYFEECWGVDAEPFVVGEWGSDEDWDVGQDDEWEATDGW